ncbi:N-acetyl-gamma-glutamyl-phosphate reductase [Alkalispirochaeta americana]|uniref:N-acetyl-gamma-glutamyl-phosphate reductase n=1 Tax=Alkalispirochaeta americana TaxID=159291 RepID=A0A1N6V9R7_9SPIO|nr:N-acetyl-gamma-glutamyl-phosphate reductase [Alkalispirochaeta americana]SIQ74630.1 N-acetyl-gamma-glutamyl-phosphate reductase [Alkalispirochaeta americana]
MKATILGATGYTGMVLLRILAQHPRITGITASSRTMAGRPLAEADPGLSRSTLEKGCLDPIVRSPAEALESPGDVLFSALPHGASADTCSPVLGKTLVIDLSADFRFSDPRSFAASYGTPPPQAEFQSRSVYGLSEWNRDLLKNAEIIANPGCYPTATLLPLLPLRDQIRRETPLVVNALSGITGAGKKEKTNLLYAERTENATAYSVGRQHRHTGEIAEQLETEQILFSPHLIPVKQGMLVTTTISVRDGNAAVAALEERYRSEPFVTLTGSAMPETRHVRGTNHVRIGWQLEGNSLILVSAIDNLWKGAAGQAVQNMNIRFGFDETEGLQQEADL